MNVVVVTGGSSGIGRATARLLAVQGLTVVILDAKPPRTDLEAPAAHIFSVLGDVADPSSHDEAQSVAHDIGRVVGWVNAAAVTYRAPLHEVEFGDLNRTVAVNLVGVFLGCRAAVRAFQRQSSDGAIVNLSSVHASVGFKGWSVYDACKGGIEALTRSVCAEYAHRGIRCNAVSPGAILTEGTRHLAGEEIDQLLPLWAKTSPTGRLGKPEEVAHVIEFLLSPAASYINGTVVTADGGMTAAFPDAAEFRQE